MLVSHRHQFIYTKTLKTAGTSVEAYFEPYCMAEGEWTLSHGRDQYVSASGIIGQRGHVRPQHQWWNHMPAERIRAQLGEAVWSRYFKFCVVRNPFEKVVSMFYFRRAGKRTTVVLDASTSDVEQFRHWMRMEALPSDKEVYTIGGHICMDRIARHESLQADLADICATLNLPWTPDALPRFKAHVRPPSALAKDLHNAETIAIVERVYGWELATFGYRPP